MVDVFNFFKTIQGMLNIIQRNVYFKIDSLLPVRLLGRRCRRNN